jgi:hypothetical protein
VHGIRPLVAALFDQFRSLLIGSCKGTLDWAPVANQPLRRKSISEILTCRQKMSVPGHRNQVTFSELSSGTMMLEMGHEKKTLDRR